MEESQLITLTTVTASGVVCQRSCLIYSICGIGLAQANNVYGVHNGQTSSAERKFRLAAGSYSTDFRLFAAPLFFSKGLYIEFITNGEEVFVQYMQIGI